jgi:hypothetical protein
MPSALVSKREPVSELRTVPGGVWLVFGLALVIHLAAATVGWNHRLVQNDVSGFRQTQTALSTYWMLGHRYQLAYETPVLGPPWSVPYEFPLYQWLVAGLVTVTDWPLDQTGRAVSEAFFLLCLAPCWFLLGKVNVQPRHRLLALALLLVTPFYLFWSRAFLIESTALFLTLGYLAAAWACLDRPRPALFLLALGLGMLAALVKITTCAAAWLALTLLLPALWAGRERLVRTGMWLALVAGSVATGLLWTRYADGIKELNPFARHLTSSALQEWNFGGWGRRWQGWTWQVVFGRNPAIALQTAWLIASLFLVWLAGRRRALVTACVLIHLALPLVFTNLYFTHEYYAFASVVFQIGAASFALIGLSERGGRWAWLGSGIAFLLVVSALGSYWISYYPSATTNLLESAAVCKAVQERTDKEDVIVVLGCDWSAEVPYYSRRRALMIPSWNFTPLTDLPRYLEPLRDYRIGAVVVRREAVSESDIDGVLRDLRAVGIVPRLEFSDGVYSLYHHQHAAE